MPPLYAPKLNQPMSSPMMTTMLGFAVPACATAGLTGNCACATLPQARGSARTAVAKRLLLIIDVPSSYQRCWPPVEEDGCGLGVFLTQRVISAVLICRRR